MRPIPQTTVDPTAAGRQSGQTHADLRAVEFRKCAFLNAYSRDVLQLKANGRCVNAWIRARVVRRYDRLHAFLRRCASYVSKSAPMARTNRAPVFALSGTTFVPKKTMLVMGFRPFMVTSPSPSKRNGFPVTP